MRTVRIDTSLLGATLIKDVGQQPGWLISLISRALLGWQPPQLVLPSQPATKAASHQSEGKRLPSNSQATYQALGRERTQLLSPGLLSRAAKLAMLSCQQQMWDLIHK